MERICAVSVGLRHKKIATMAKEPAKGDAVKWNSHGGEAHGKVVRKIVNPMIIKGHKVAASKHNPEFLVETPEGKQAAHKADALKPE